MRQFAAELKENAESGFSLFWHKLNHSHLDLSLYIECHYTGLWIDKYRKKSHLINFVISNLNVSYIIGSHFAVQ